MPICRTSSPLLEARPGRQTVRLSRYVVTRRVPPRAANDNWDPWKSHAWQWALAVGVAPTLAVVLLFAGLF